MSETIIRDGLVARRRDGAWSFEGAVVVVRDDRIDAVLEPGQIEPDRLDRAAQVIDASDHLVIPGLIDSHFHSYGSLGTGLIENRPLEIRGIYHGITMAANSERQVYLAAQLAIAESLRGGTTTLIENLVAPLRFAHAAAQAYLDAGMRVVLSPTMLDKPYHETVPPFLDGLAPVDRERARARKPLAAEAQLGLLCELIQEWHGKDGLVTVGVSPSAPLRCTDRFLEQCRNLAEERSLGLHTHFCESRVQQLMAYEVYGESMAAHLGRIGLLNPRMSLAHSVWLTRDDIERIARAGASVAHNPASNLALGSGIAPVPAMLQAGVNVGIGSDGPNCGGHGVLFEAIKLAALLPKVARIDYDYDAWLTAEDAFTMATIGGARALNLQDEVGAIEPGKKADLVLVNRRTTALTPLNGPLWQLVYSENGSAVHTVMVNGRLVVEDGRVTTLDLEALLAEAPGTIAELLEQNRELVELARIQDRPLQAACRALVEAYPPGAENVTRVRRPTGAVSNASL